MFKRNHFYAKAHWAEPIDEAEFLTYVKTFETIIIWGAGNLGKSVYKYLNKIGIKVHIIWDKQHKTLKSFDNIAITNVFDSEYDKSQSLVFFCIINGSTGGQWAENLLKSHGYNNFIDGMSFYEGLICPINKQTGLDHSICLKSKSCSICSCDRFVNLVRHYENMKNHTDHNYQMNLSSIEVSNNNGNNKSFSKFSDELHFNDKWQGGDNDLIFNTLTFIVNQKCSLKCIHCGQFMNEYDNKHRLIFDKSRIKKDIDIIFDAIETIGMVSIIGGEPFLHPDLSEIVSYILEKPNFGIINITTNGIFKLKEKQLLGLEHNRVKVSFSHYDGAISDNQQRIFDRNVEIMEKNNIKYTIGVPVWIRPTSLESEDLSISRMKELKSSCNAIKLCMSVKNGYFYPCSKTEPLHSLNLIENETDYLRLDDYASRFELQSAIKEIRQREYYESCSTCNDRSCETLPLAGIQLGMNNEYR